LTDAPAPVACVEVAVPVPLPGPLTYSTPAELVPHLRPGQRVRVPVGRRVVTGVVWRPGAGPPAGFEVRGIGPLLDLEPALPGELLDLARFVSDYYLAPLGEVVAAMLPAELPAWGSARVAVTDAGALASAADAGDAALLSHLMRHGRSTRSDLLRALPGTELPERLERLARAGRVTIDDAPAGSKRYATAVELAAGDRERALAAAGRSAPARRAIEHLATLGRPATLEELRAEAGVSAGVVRRLLRLGALRGFTQPVRRSLDRHLLGGATNAAEPLRLTAAQADALAAIERGLESAEFSRYLLQGATGSGKTEVYLRAAETALRLGRAALLLVPEIALVPALARAATDRFGDRAAVLHSGLGAAERQQEWRRIRSGEARVVVGPRSAVFAPVVDLGLVVVDEEQDAAYKQESPPRYHGRDVALARCRTARAVAVLVSATPSLEARAAADQGRFERLRLAGRVGNARLPEGVLVDLRREARVGRPGDVRFSARLLEELRAALAAGDQAILLRNRRGFAPMLLCRGCGEDFRCADCGLARTYHRRAARLICHYCGSSRPAPVVCPACRAEALEPLGAGTERVESELAELLPEARIDVLDRDAARREGGPSAILERFRRGETQILVGTQMLSKGHHFPGVALTGVLSADDYLGFPDFRAVERTYSLLTQLAGRAGRGERPGRVVLQTWHPEHYAIRAALEHDDAAFAEQELRFRRLFGYPPFSRVVLLLARDRGRERARERIERVAERLRPLAEAGELRLSGPAPAPFERLRGEWRFQCLVRAESGSRLRRAVAEALRDRPAGDLQVDVDPQQLL
jgi:primosomal protein N' (replication factor Y)